MRIALLHPTYWPEVRRGSERLAHDLGPRSPGAATTSPCSPRHDARRAARARGRSGRRAPAASATPPGPHLYEDHLATRPGHRAGVLRGGFELAHALYPVDGWAARLARLGGPRYVLSIHGILDRQYLVRRRHRLEMIQGGRGAAAATAP